MCPDVKWPPITTSRLNPGTKRTYCVLYDANTLGQITPESKPFGKFFWYTDGQAVHSMKQLE
jgi:hypothetical protein